MSWVTETNIRDCVQFFAQSPIEHIQDLYTDTITVKLGNTTHPTSIISTTHWIHPETRPTITIEDDRETNIQTEDLHALATLTAFNTDGRTNISQREIRNYMWNGNTYTINSPLNLDQPITELSIQKTDFFSVISHTAKLLGSLYTDSYTDPRDPRRKHFDTAASLARNIRSYYRPLGGSYLTIVTDTDGTHYLLIGRRSGKVALWPNALASFPSGHFKPNEVTHGDVFDQQLLGEFAREAMDIKVESQPDNETKGVRGLEQLFRANEASFTLTGFGIEGATVAAETVGLLHIDYPEYTEYLFENLEDSYEVDHITALPINNSLPGRLNTLFKNQQATPQTLFALGTGLTYLKHETDIEVPFSVSLSGDTL